MWFICYDEFIGNSDIAFKWNEFENISLEAAEEDISWQEDIRLLGKSFTNYNVCCRFLFILRN